MQAVILAAGKGTRMRPLTSKLPKPLLQIGGQRILEHTIEQLHGIVDEVILVVGYRGKLIQKSFRDNYKGIKITYAWQKKQSGTGDAAKQALPFLKGPCLFINGDDLYDKRDIKKILGKYPSILVATTEHPERYAVIETKGNRVISLLEKPKHPTGNLVSVGMYFLDPLIFQWNIKKSSRGEYEFTDYIRKWLKKKTLHYVISSRWIPITTPENLLEAKRILKLGN